MKDKTLWIIITIAYTASVALAVDGIVASKNYEKRIVAIRESARIEASEALLNSMFQVHKSCVDKTFTGKYAFQFTRTIPNKATPTPISKTPAMSIYGKAGDYEAIALTCEAIKKAYYKSN